MAFLRTSHEANFPKRFSDVLNQVFDEASRVQNGGKFVPTVNLSETDKTYEVEANLPGMKKDDINVELDGNTLKISGQKQKEDEEKGKTYHLIETEYGHFQRQFEIPEDGNTDNIEAKYESGVLKLSIPKSKQKQSGKKIDIN